MQYLESGVFDALFILGDLFEVWVGDDVLDAPSDDPEHRFIRRCSTMLNRASQRADLYFMHGNRDFLVGTAFAKASGITLLADPCILQRDQQRWLLSHGDAWCLSDQDYLRFRETVRQPGWQSTFLARPLAEREAIARQLRMQSQQHQQSILNQGQSFADVANALALEWLLRTGCTQLIHGHTHRPGLHTLTESCSRIVLSDWDACAQPPRLEALSLQPDGRLLRVPIAS